MKTKSANSVSEYIKIACNVRLEWTTKADEYFDPWFRGHRDESWDLEPNIFRLKLEGNESELRGEFIRRGRQLHSEYDLRDEWDWYFVMQHYRAPTRLLDWTDSALVALFFAINSNLAGFPEVGCDAAVWMLDPWWLNRQVIRLDSILQPDFDDARPYLPKTYSGELRRRYPVAIDPPYIARRLGAQRSHFTIHGNRRDGLMQLARRAKSHLVKIVLPKESIPDMRTDLVTCGVSDTTLFPDLEGLSRELTRFYTEDWFMDS
jgi:FRG domain